MKETLRNLLRSINKVFVMYRKSLLNKSQPFGLYVGQPQVLAYIMRNPGCTQIEIADNLGVSSASIAFSTKRLQKAGYLMKQVNNLNMRCNKLYVTHEGLEVLKNFGDTYDDLNLTVFDGFSEEELEQLASYTERICQNLDKILSEE